MKLIKWLVGSVLLLIIVIGFYLLAALGGTYLKWPTTKLVDLNPKKNVVRLLVGTLHADIAIKATPDLIERFPFLRESTLPLNHPELRFISFGWGSKAFYTTAGSYSDITLKATARAITGDDAVMRVVALGDISKLQGNITLNLSDRQFIRLLLFIRRGFSDSPPKQLLGASIGPDDVFYNASGHFNVFYPCNQWVNDALNFAGLQTGGWTPTTYSLRRSLAFYNSN